MYLIIEGITKIVIFHYRNRIGDVQVATVGKDT